MASAKTGASTSSAAAASSSATRSERRSRASRPITAHDGIKAAPSRRRSRRLASVPVDTGTLIAREHRQGPRRRHRARRRLGDRGARRRARRRRPERRGQVDAAAHPRRRRRARPGDGDADRGHRRLPPAGARPRARRDPARLPRAAAPASPPRTTAWTSRRRAWPPAEAGAEEAYSHALEEWLGLGGADLEPRAEAVCRELGLDPGAARAARPSRCPAGRRPARRSPRSCSPASASCCSTSPPTTSTSTASPGWSASSPSARAAP